MLPIAGKKAFTNIQVLMNYVVDFLMILEGNNLTLEQVSDAKETGLN